MLVATIIRDKKTAKIHVRYDTTPQTGGDVEVLEVLNGKEKNELEGRAEGFAKRLRLAIASLS